MRGYTVAGGDSDDDDSAAADGEEDAEEGWVDERIDAFSACVTLQKDFAEAVRAVRSDVAPVAAPLVHGAMLSACPRSEDGGVSTAASARRLVRWLWRSSDATDGGRPCCAPVAAGAMATLAF